MTVMCIRVVKTFFWSFSQTFFKGFGSGLKLPAVRVYCKTMLTESRKSLCSNRLPSNPMRLVRCCSTDGKVLIAEQSKPIDKPKNNSIVISTLSPYLELMRFSRPTGTYIVCYKNNFKLLIRRFIFRLVAFILAMHMEHSSGRCCRRISKL